MLLNTPRPEEHMAKLKKMAGLGRCASSGWRVGDLQFMTTGWVFPLLPCWVVLRAFAVQLSSRL